MPPIPPADRFCDLVMKGGITSGVVYPPAIFKLAHEYRFKNIGGTSAGAIAAAVAAAAEYRRRHEHTMKGFELVGRLPRMLQEQVRGKSQLLRLFQADPSCRRLFRILIGSLNASGTFRRITAVLFGCATSYWMGTLASILISLWVGFVCESIHGAILVFLTTLPLFIGLLIYFDVTRNVVGNNYGLCKGMTTKEHYGPALTPWLHKLIQDAAGLKMDRPLTFGDLWKAPGGPQAPPGSTAPPRSIDLEMFTTNLSHGRPYTFPHFEPTARLFYNPEELTPYLPEEVMTHFNRHAIPYARNSFSPMSDPDPLIAKQLNLHEIPSASHFPILLAARMSLSFPILFSAVPLWAIDYEHPREGRGFKRCLFSDGGISSNFPMHLFDGLVPQWPTFGIDLEPEIKDLPGRTFLPERYLQGIADRWNRFDQETKAASRMGGFMMGIVNTMQNWNDNTQSRLAGVRDRVVRVRLEKDEGGLNLNMPPGVINDVATRGGEAADSLIARFLGSADADGWSGWASQRWMRLDVFIYALNQKIAALRHALGGNLAESEPLDTLIGLAKVTAPPGHDKPLTDAQADALRNLVKALDDTARQFASFSAQYPNNPVPEPELRARSPL